MLWVFGKDTCKTCLKKKAELQNEGIEFEYYGLDTAEGLAKAASLDLLSEEIDLPIIIEIGIDIEKAKDYTVKREIKN